MKANAQFAGRYVLLPAGDYLTISPKCYLRLASTTALGVSTFRYTHSGNKANVQTEPPVGILREA
jgi:hypothetical protein